MSIVKDEIILASDLLVKVEELEKMIENVEKKINKGYNIVYANSVVPSSSADIIINVPTYDFVEIISYKPTLKNSEQTTNNIIDVPHQVSTILTPNVVATVNTYNSLYYKSGSDDEYLTVTTLTNSIQITKKTYGTILNIICYKKEV